MDDRILKFADSRQFIGRIARSGENNTRSLAFDCSAALAEYPTAQIIAVIQRPQGDPYTVTPDADGTIIRITLTSYDLEFNGHLQIELRVINGNKILKSAIYTATVDDSIRGEADAPGQPVRDVLDRLDVEIKQAQAVVDDIHQKLENGEFNGSDATVTAENIQAALGYAPVKDVQVAGSSVLADGVANVPLATKTVNGVMRPDFYGVGVSPAGILYVQNTSNPNITSRVSSAPLTAYNLDYAVKAAMCDGKGAAWTSAEQKAAQERMGVDKAYELIEEITLTEKVTELIRNAEPNGTLYHFKKMYVNITTPQAEENGSIYSMFNDIIIALALDSIITQWPEGGIAQIYAHVANGLLDGYGVGAANVSAYSNLIRYVNPSDTPSGIAAIESVTIHATVNMPINTNIKIYGVRA